MGNASFSVLEKHEIERIHEASLAALRTVGMKIDSPKALELLRSAGAEVDNRTQTVKIQESLVAEAIRNCAKEFVLGSRDGTRDLMVPAMPRPWLCTDGFATEILDVKSGERRSSTNTDLVGFARLADALDPLDFFWPIVNPSDSPPGAQMFRAFVTAMENTGKHVQHEALGAHMARLQIAAASRIVGGEKELARRPIFSAVQCPIAPLLFEAASIEAAMEFAKAGVPVVYMSMPMMGASAPITIAGSIVQGHAEVLGGLTVSQLANKGARVFHSVLAGPIDMKTGVWASGSPENAVGNAAAAQVAKHLGLPSMEGGFGTCAKFPGVQIGYEKMATMVPTALSRTDLITGIGGFDDAKCTSMVQAVIDAEMWTLVLRMLKGIDTSSGALGLESMRDVGPGGLFLSHKETMQKFKTELWQPTLDERTTLDKWKSEGVKDVVLKRATERAVEMSMRPPKNPLPQDVERELEEMLKAELKST